MPAHSEASRRRRVDRVADVQSYVDNHETWRPVATTWLVFTGLGAGLLIIGALAFPLLEAKYNGRRHEVFFLKQHDGSNVTTVVRV